MMKNILLIVLMLGINAGCSSRSSESKTATKIVEPTYNFEGRNVKSSELVQILSYRLYNSENKIRPATVKEIYIEVQKPPQIKEVYVETEGPPQIKEIYVEIDKGSEKFSKLKKTIEDFVSSRPCVEFYETSAGSFVIKEIFSCGAQGRPIG